MASDENPFARNSAWPKMPQAPFRVGALPKAAPLDAAVLEPKKITPLFVRPADADTPMRPAFADAQLAAEPLPFEPDVAASPEPSPEPPAEPPSEPPQAAVELAPLFVEPPRRAKPAHRRSLMPALVATAVGVVGIIGFALLLSGVQQAALKADASSPALSAVAGPAAEVPALQTDAVEAAGVDSANVQTSTPQAEPAPPPILEAPLARVVIAKPRSAPARVRPRAPVQAPPLAAEDVAAAVEQTLSAPPLILRPAPVIPASPPAKAAEPAARDPDAPMTTRVPYS